MLKILQKVNLINKIACMLLIALCIHNAKNFTKSEFKNKEALINVKTLQKVNLINKEVLINVKTLAKSVFPVPGDP